MLRQFSIEQVRDVWRRHYGYYENGRLVDPTKERIEWVDRITTMTIQDWYNVHMAHIIKYPHRITFDLLTIDLGHWIEKIVDINSLEYLPKC